MNDAAMDTGGLRVLLAEDNGTNRVLTVRMLRRLGHESEEARDGRAALNAAAARVYDVILMDVQMPELDGLAATRLIRALPAPFCCVPILGVTGSTAPDDERACLAAGMDGFLGKPFTTARLGEAIAAALAVRGRCGESHLLDETFLAGLADDIGLEGVQEAVALFLDQVPARMARIRAAAGPGGTIGRDTHALAGAARALGLVRLGEAAAQIEADNATLDLPRVESLLDLLRESSDRLAGWFAANRNGAVP
jgi:CheY-like chemotaxis protein